jgi:hypothetical protein
MKASLMNNLIDYKKNPAHPIIKKKKAVFAEKTRKSHP